MATENLGLETTLIGAGPTLENTLVRNFEKLDAAVGEGGGEVSIDWTDVTGKPSTFPPAAHSHGWADVTGKPATFPPTIGTTAATAAAGNHTHSNYATTGALSALEARVEALELAAAG